MNIMLIYHIYCQLA